MTHSVAFCFRLATRSLSWLAEALKGVTPQNEVQCLTLLLQEETLQQAIHINSASLYEQVGALMAGQPVPLPARLALWRYVFRAASRSTPFGLMAGVGVGYYGNQKEVLSLSYRPVYRTDSSLLAFISQQVSDDATYREQLQYRLNNSLYQAGNELRYSVRGPQQNGQQVDLASYENSDVLSHIFHSMGEGRLWPWEEIVGLFGSDPDRESVHAFIHQLIDDGFLQSELTLPVTGLSMSAPLGEILHRIAHPLSEVLESFMGQRAEGLNNIQLVRQIQQKLTGHTGQTGLPIPGHLIQTDTFVDTQPGLSPYIPRGLIRQLQELKPLLEQPINPLLSDFASRFRRRFEGQQIPLLQALDLVTGVGYDPVSRLSDSLLNELPLPQANNRTLPSARQRILIERLYARHIGSGHTTVLLTEPDVLAWNTDRLETLDFSPSSFVLGELYTKPSDDSRHTQPLDWQFALKTLTGPSIGTLTGRFCYGCPKLNEQVKTWLDQEQQHYPNDILAEVVHLPSDRTGNIVARPQLRPYEIPYITPPSVDEAHTVWLSDLRVSVASNGEVVLFSNRFQKRVRPRLSSAHNTRLGDEVYSFLSDVMQQERVSLPWNWYHLDSLPFLPRITYKNLILSRARWVIRPGELPPVCRRDIDQLSRYFKLPRYVVLVEGDNELVLDLDCFPARACLLEIMGKADRLLLLEWLTDSLETYQPWLRFDDQPYASELIIPLLKAVEAPRSTSLTTPTKEVYSFDVVSDDPLPITRRFLPGDDWFYLKVYGGEQTLETILRDEFRGLLQEKGVEFTFFFIRYDDPDRHLRLRFKRTGSSWQTLRHWQHKLAPYHDKGLIFRIEVGTYERELERYTPYLMVHFERLFAIDTRLFIKWLTEQGEGVSESARYRFALQSTRALLTDLDLTLEEKTKLVSQLQESFFREHGGQSALKAALNKQYRTHQADFFSEPVSELTRLFSERTKHIQLFLGDLQTTRHALSLSEPRWLLTVGSLLHMNMNRLFAGEARHHELIIYHFLARYYSSQQALSKTATFPK